MRTRIIAGIACLVILGAVVIRSNRFLVWAVRHNSDVLVRLSLLSGTRATAKIDSRTVLMEAAARAEDDVVKTLLAYGASVNDSDSENRQALHYAARNSESTGAVAVLLLEAGARPDVVTRDGITPIHEAVSQLSGGSEANAIAMIAFADEVNQQDREGNTALLIATTEAKLEVVRCLLRAGANPNLANHKGKLPLTEAVANGLTDRMRILIEFGADPKLRVGNEPSAEQIAATRSNTDPQLRQTLENLAQDLGKSSSRTK